MIALFVPNSCQALGSRSAASLAVVIRKLLTTVPGVVGVTMKPELTSPKFRYLASEPSIALATVSPPGEELTPSASMGMIASPGERIPVVPGSSTAAAPKMYCQVGAGLVATSLIASGIVDEDAAVWKLRM